MEECASCSKPIYSAERLAIQNVPLHRSCFDCNSCGRKLSLLNYTTFRGAFYCKVHYSLLADAKGRIQEENPTVKQNDQQLPTALLPSSESETKTRNKKTEKVLMREKMQPRLSRFQPQSGLRSPPVPPPRQLGNELASRNKFRISWPLLKEAANGGAGKTVHKASKKLLQETVSILHNQSRADGITQKALEDKSIAETVHMEKKPGQLRRVTFPKRGEHVSHWIKTVGGSRDGGIPKKRVSFIDRSIPGVPPRKQDPAVSERTTVLDHDMLKLTRRLPTVSPLTSILAKPSSAGSFPSDSKALRASKVTRSAATRVAVPDASGLAKASLESNKLSKTSSSKDVPDERSKGPDFQRAEPLLRLPLLTSPDDRQKKKQLPEESKSSNILITPTLEEAEQFSHDNTEAKCEMEGQKSSQTEPEAPGYPTEHKEERNYKATGHADKMPSYPGSVETSLTTDQISGHSWVSGNGQHMEITYPESLQSFGLHLCAKAHTKMTEMEEEEEEQPGRKLEIFETLHSATDQAFQDAEPKEKPISLAAEIGDDQSVSSLQAADSGNMNVPPRNSPQDTSVTCNVTSSANENPEPVGLSVRNTTTNGELPEKASGGNNIQLTSQEDTFEGTVLQASVPQVKEPKPFNSHGEPYFTSKNATENVGANLHSDDSVTVQAAQGKTTTDDSARKPLLKRESNPFACLFASKIQGGVPKQEPAGVKKAPKTRSALVTLFGYSSDKGKNPKERPEKTLTNPSVETSDEQLQFAARLKSGAFKKEGNSVAVTQAGDSEASLQDSENLGSQSREGERESALSLQHAKGFSANTLSTDSGAGISSNVPRNEEP